MRLTKQNRFDAVIEKTSWPSLTFYTVSWKYWHKGGYLMTETATFHEYNEAKELYNKINA